MLELTAKKIIDKYHPIIIGVLSADGVSGIKESLSTVLETKFSVRTSRAVAVAESVYEEILGIKKSEFSSTFLFKIVPLLFFKKDFPEVVILEFSASDRDSIKKLGKIGINFDFLIIGSIAGNSGKLTDVRNLLKIVSKKTKIIINRDDKNFARISAELKEGHSTYSAEKSDACVYALAMAQGNNKWLMNNGKIGITFKICHRSNTVPVRLEKIIGKGYVSSIVASYPVGLALGMNLVEISEALQNYKGIPGKMNLIPGIKNTMIISETGDIACDSVKEAISVFKKISNRRKVAVVGDILKLGGDAEQYHRKIGRSIAAAGAEVLIAVGERAIFVRDEAIKAGIKENNIFMFDEEEISQAGIFVQDKIKENDLILVIGSRELNTDKIIKEIMAVF